MYVHHIFKDGDFEYLLSTEEVLPWTTPGGTPYETYSNSKYTWSNAWEFEETNKMSTGVFADGINFDVSFKEELVDKYGEVVAEHIVSSILTNIDKKANDFSYVAYGDFGLYYTVQVNTRSQHGNSVTGKRIDVYYYYEPNMVTKNSESAP